MSTGTIPGVILSRVLARYIGLPAAIAMTLFSAHKAHRAYRKLKDLEAELIDPLKEEAMKWSGAISQLGGAREELTYSQKRHFSEFTSRGSEAFRNGFTRRGDDPFIERHFPDPERAYTLICNAKASISRCSDIGKREEKETMERILSKMANYIYALRFKRDSDFGPIRNWLKEAMDQLKRIRSDYYYRISQNQKRIDVKFDQWLLSAGISLATAGVFGTKGFK